MFRWEPGTRRLEGHERQYRDRFRELVRQAGAAGSDEAPAPTSSLLAGAAPSATNRAIGVRFLRLPIRAAIAVATVIRPETATHGRLRRTSAATVITALASPTLKTQLLGPIEAAVGSFFMQRHMAHEYVQLFTRSSSLESARREVARRGRWFRAGDGSRAARPSCATSPIRP